MLIPGIDSNVGEVQMDEDHSDEEAAVYVGDEIPSDNESQDAPSDFSEVENEIISRGRNRVRGCPPGCDCERPIGGRACGCERRFNGLCGLSCQCDRSKCRTTVKDDSDDE